MTIGECNEKHKSSASATRWAIGIIITVLLLVTSAAAAFISDSIKRGAEHEVRIQHLENSTQKALDKVDGNLSDMRRILEEIKNKK